jgi:hypothetical protein
MKASELRLGNIISFRGNHICLDTNYELFKSLVDISRRNDKRYKPIPLSEEWLLKFGFKQCGYEMLSWKHETLLPSFDLGGINWADFDEPDYQFLTYKVGDEILRIDYVHQLQNLYFALTGEELTVKESSNE